MRKSWFNGNKKEHEIRRGNFEDKVDEFRFELLID